MNNKQAKKIRRAAEELTIGKPKIIYNFTDHQLKLAKGCTRKVYKILKKLYKDGQQRTNTT